ncbi:MAG: hypothetical protein AAFN93_08390 [Bacteroidota bacterium]
MAELDIKDIWKKSFENASESETLDVDEVIGKKSKTILDKIRFILRIEFWLNNIITPVCTVTYFIYLSAWQGILVGIFGSIYFVYYLFLLRAIRNFDYTGDVKESLTKVYKYLKFYLLHYKVVIWVSFVVVIWAAFGYGFYLGYTGQDPPFQQEVPQFEFTKRQAYFFMAAMIVIPVLIAALLHYLINLIYGIKIKKLKLIIDDLGDD